MSNYTFNHLSPTVHLDANTSAFQGVHRHQASRTKRYILTVHTKCVSRPWGCRRRNAKTRKRQARKREKTKTRKRRKHNPFRSTLNTNVITDLGMCKLCIYASSPFRSNLNTLSQLWACAKYVPKQPIP